MTGTRCRRHSHRTATRRALRERMQLGYRSQRLLHAALRQRMQLGYRCRSVAVANRTANDIALSGPRELSTPASTPHGGAWLGRVHASSVAFPCAAVSRGGSHTGVPPRALRDLPCARIAPRARPGAERSLRGAPRPRVPTDLRGMSTYSISPARSSAGASCSDRSVVAASWGSICPSTSACARISADLSVSMRSKPSGCAVDGG